MARHGGMTTHKSSDTTHCCFDADMHSRCLHRYAANRGVEQRHRLATLQKRFCFGPVCLCLSASSLSWQMVAVFSVPLRGKSKKERRKTAAESKRRFVHTV